MASRGNLIKGSRILVLGITFKNCPDVRNTKVIDIVNILNEYKIKIEVYDPCADFSKIRDNLDMKIVKELPSNKKYDAILVAVGHNEFKGKSKFWEDLIVKDRLIFDLKDIVPRDIVTLRL